MIAIDTSAIMAILLDEPKAEACMAAIENADGLIISAGTLAELLIVAGRRGVGREAASLIDGLDCEIVAVTAASARRIDEAYGRWGKGVHPAGLNLGDCFAYAAAKEHGCRLLHVGNDFSKTDLETVP